MRIIACVKQVANIPGQVQLLPSGEAVDPYFLEHELNEPDRYAIEEALRVRDDQPESQIIALTLGDEKADGAVREALSMGVDRAVRVDCEPVSFDPIAVARGLASAIQELDADLVFAGIQSSDESQQVTGVALSAVLDWPCIVGALSLNIKGDRIEVHRELDSNRVEVVETSLPAVIIVQTGINQPRYGTFKDKLNAKKAPVELIALTESLTKKSLTPRRLVPPTNSGQNVDMIDGGPVEVAQRIISLIQDVPR